MGLYYMAGLLSSTTPVVAVGLRNVEINQGLDTVMEGVGDLHQNSAATISLTPTFNVTSLDLEDMIGFMSQDPTVMAAAAITLLSFDSTTGILASGSVHQKFTAANASFFPQTLSWQQGQPAEFEGVIQTISPNGSTPAIEASSVSIPTIAGLGRMFTLNSVTVGGTEVLKMTAVSVNFGLQLTPMRDGGELYCSVALSSARDPMISITSQDSAEIALLASAGSVVLEFGEMTEVGRDSATVTVTAATAHVVPQSSTAQVRGQGSQTAELKPYAAPGADVFTVAYDAGGA